MTIYREKRKGGYTTYLLRWKQGGQIMKEASNDLQKALQRGHEVATQIAEGRADMNDVTPLKREIYADLEKRVKHTGLTLAQVVEKFVELWEPDVVELTLSEAFDRFISSKSGLSKRHRDDIAQKLGSLCKKFGNRKLYSIKRAEYTSFIEARSTHQRTRSNYLNLFKNFLTYSKENGYVSRKTSHALVGVEYPCMGGADDKILPSKDLIRIFEEISRREDEHDNILTLGLQAFAGVRVAEFRRLTWEDIHFDGETLISLDVNRHKAKTKTRRSITATDELKALFARVEIKKTGPLTRYVKPDRVIHKIAEKAGIEWPKNGLRHTFITHELSRSKDVNKVAYFAGNSAHMIETRYKGLSVPSETEAWFKVAFNLPPPYKLRQRYKELHGTPPVEPSPEDVNQYDDLSHDPHERETR